MRHFNLEEYLKNPSQQVITSDHRKVRIVCTDRKSGIDDYYPVLALVEEYQGLELLRSYSRYGQCNICRNSVDDLYFAPKRHRGFINIYGNNRSSDTIYKTADEAHKAAEENDASAENAESLYIDTIEVWWKE